MGKELTGIVCWSGGQIFTWLCGQVFALSQLELDSKTHLKMSGL
jgi:hypothetical protein